MSILPLDRQIRETIEDWGRKLMEQVIADRENDALYPEILFTKKPSRAKSAENPPQ